MPTTTAQDNCWLCDKIEVPDNSWSLQSLKYIKNCKFYLCEKHDEFINKKIEELTKEQPKKYMLKAESFVPPIVKETKSFYEREPGEDDN